MCREEAFTSYYTLASALERLRFGVSARRIAMVPRTGPAAQSLLFLTMHAYEHVKSPTSRCTKRNDKRNTDEAARRRAFAPALEHRDQSNEEKQDRSGR